MNVSIDKAGDAAVIHLKGSLDADSVALFKKKTANLIGTQKINLVLDASSLEFVDSMGLGVLISLLRKVRAVDGDMKVAGLKQEVRDVFEITRLHRLFDIFPDSESAQKSFQA